MIATLKSLCQLTPSPSEHSPVHSADTDLASEDAQLRTASLLNSGACEDQIAHSDQQRFEQLKASCPALADGFEGFDFLIAVYLRECPRRPGDSETCDCNRFLRWLDEQVDLTDSQRDLVVDQLSRNAVEFVALKQKLAHVRFQQLLSASEPMSPESARHLSQFVYLHPIHVWATYESQALLDEDTNTPATVLFFPFEHQIRTVVLSDSQRALIRELEQGPQTVRSLLRSTPKADREQLLADLAKFVEMKLIALAATS